MFSWWAESYLGKTFETVEEGVRKVTRRILEKQGFDVLAASDGRVTVDLFQKYARDIALVLLDNEQDWGANPVQTETIN